MVVANNVEDPSPSAAASARGVCFERSFELIAVVEANDEELPRRLLDEGFDALIRRAWRDPVPSSPGVRGYSLTSSPGGSTAFEGVAADVVPPPPNTNTPDGMAKGSVRSPASGRDAPISRNASIVFSVMAFGVFCYNVKGEGCWGQVSTGEKR